MLKETFQIWQETAVSLGLFGLIMAMGFGLVVLGPFVLFGSSLMGVVLMMLFSLVGAFIYTIYWCAGYVAIDNYIEKRPRSAGPTPKKKPAPDSSEFLGLPVDDSLFGEFSDLPDDLPD